MRRFFIPDGSEKGKVRPAHNDARSENRKFPSERLSFETLGDGRRQVGAVFQGRDVPPDP